MNEYIEHLLEIIREAKLKTPHTFGYNCADTCCEVDQNNNLKFAEEFLQAKAQKLSSIIGIEKYNFPKVEKLNDHHLVQIVQELEELLEHYNFEFIFPEDVTLKMKYNFMIDHWEKKQVYSPYGMVQIETCKFEEDNCPFPGYCNICKDFDQKLGSEHYSCHTKADFSDLQLPQSDEEYQALRADIDQIKELFKNPLNDNFISGIHNYCDGRCQKCGFTDRCSSYVINKELDLLDGADKKSSEQKIMGLMMATSEIVQEEMQKRGIELDAAIEDISEQHYLPKSKQFVQLYAESYAQKLKHWLESNQMEIESRLIVEDRGVFNECIETITWFHLFIPAKINRALSIISCEEVDEFEQYDSNGSAKAALVAIDETIKAWQGVLFVLNHKEDTILKLLTHLSKLQEEVKNVFPEAEGFKRPGLDD